MSTLRFTFMSTSELIEECERLDAEVKALRNPSLSSTEQEFMDTLDEFVALATGRHRPTGEPTEGA